MPEGTPAFLNLTSTIVSFITGAKQSFLHLVFPHVCEGCGSDVLETHHLLCLKCLSSLPETNFQFYPNNPVEKIFWGRLPVTHATAQYYFTKESLIQHLMHQLKYKRNKEMGIYLGKLMGIAIKGSNRFYDITALIPLPLHASKEKKRGYNQAALLCQGISEITGIPIFYKAVIRTKETDSQTKKNRAERWMNMEGRFELTDPGLIKGSHALLVDDVVTTGATLEACGHAILKHPSIKLSIATLCYSSGN